MSTLKRYTSGAWENIGTPTIANAGPAATLGYSSYSAVSPVSIPSGAYDVPNLSITVTVPEGRRLRISAYLCLAGGSPTESIIMADGVALNRYHDNNASNVIVTHSWSVIDSPTAGTHTYKVRTNNNAAGTLYNDGTNEAWILVEDVTGSTLPYPAASVPVGLLAQVTNFAGGYDHTAASGVLTDIPGTMLNVSVPSGRTIRLTAKIHVSTLTETNNRVRLAIMEGSTILGVAYRVISAGSIGEELIAQIVLSPSAGSHTYKLGISRDNGAGTARIYSISTEPTLFTIEDVSPTPSASTGAPGSTLGYTEVTSSQTGITTMTTITGLASTVTVPTGRRLRISVYLPEITNNTLNQGAYVRIKEDGVVIGQGDSSHGAASAGQQIFATTIRTPVAGTHTYTCEISPQGSGTVTVGSFPTYPSYILVEDITGSIWPTGSQVTTGLIASEAWSTYVPVLTGAVTNPGMGTSPTQTGRYIKMGRTVTGQFNIKFGTGMTVGSGQYRVSLPVPRWTTGFGEVIGSGFLVDTSASTVRTVILRSIGNYAEFYFTAAGVFWAEQASPWAWGDGDEIYGSFTYEAAS